MEFEFPSNFDYKDQGREVHEVLGRNSRSLRRRSSPPSLPPSSSRQQRLHVTDLEHFDHTTDDYEGSQEDGFPSNLEFKDLARTYVHATDNQRTRRRRQPVADIANSYDIVVPIAQAIPVPLSQLPASADGMDYPPPPPTQVQNTEPRLTKHEMFYTALVCLFLIAVVVAATAGILLRPSSASSYIAGNEGM